MNRRKLGNSTIEIAPLVFGGNVFGWTADKQTSFQLLDAMLDMGLNMVDTANMYSTWASGHQGGESETVIGQWLQQSGKRDQIVLATKVGMAMGDGSQGLSKQNIIASAEASLKRLNTDFIDVYYAHRDDTEVPFAETFLAFEQLIKEGKVGAIASSNFSAERLDEALCFASENGLPKYIAHQPQYNLYDRSSYEGELENVCQKQGLGVVTYFSLASGFLTGKYRTLEDVQRSERGKAFVTSYMTERGTRIIDALDKIASRHKTKPATVALAWLIQHPGVTAPIASATSVAQLKELVAATELTLTEQDIQQLNTASGE